MKKVVIEDGGDTQFLEKQIIEKADFLNENDRMFGMVVVTDAEVLKRSVGQMVSARRMRDENSSLVRRDLPKWRAATPFQPRLVRCSRHHGAPCRPNLIRRILQETTKVLNEVVKRQARPLARIEET